MRKKCHDCDELTYTDKERNPLSKGWSLTLHGNKKPRRKYHCPKHSEKI